MRIEQPQFPGQDWLSTLKFTFWIFNSVTSCSPTPETTSLEFTSPRSPVLLHWQSSESSWAVLWAQYRDSVIPDKTLLSKQLRWNTLMSLITSIQEVYTVPLSSPVISPWNSPHQCNNFIISTKPQFRSLWGGRGGGAAHPGAAQGVSASARGVAVTGPWGVQVTGICQELQERWHAQQGCVSPGKQQAVKRRDSSHSHGAEQPAMSNADKMHIQRNSIWAKSYWHIQTPIYRSLPKCCLEHMSTHSAILQYCDKTFCRWLGWQ